MQKTSFDLIRYHEGLRLTVYCDTNGHPTIGYGRALDTHGISQDEATLLLLNDVKECLADITALFGERLPGMTTARGAALVDMRFNLGGEKFRQFTKLIAAVQISDWSTAADEALNSIWSTEVGARAKFDADLLRTGVWPA